MTYRIAVLPGDGIGPEVIREAVRVVEAVGAATGIAFDFTEAPIGGAAVEATGDPLPPETEQACLAAGAILLGAVGGPRWDREPAARRPETGLLGCGRRWAPTPTCGRCGFIGPWPAGGPCGPRWWGPASTC